jgi:thymidylate kinase
MDSKRLSPRNYVGLKKRLALIENKIYEMMPNPDVLFYLLVPVEIAVKRNEERIKEGKESEEFIRIRHEENKNLIYQAKLNYKINTNRNYDEVIQEIKGKVWGAI